MNAQPHVHVHRGHRAGISGGSTTETTMTLFIQQLGEGRNAFNDRVGDRRNLGERLPFGSWGTKRAGKGRIFWVAYRWLTEQRLDGFAATEEEAINAAHAAAVVLFPGGGVISRNQGIAADMHKEHHAKRTEFKGDGFAKYPFWRGKTHLYSVYRLYGMQRTPFDPDKHPEQWRQHSKAIRSHAIVAVTEKRVFITKEPHAAVWLGGKIARKDCFSLSRDELEAKGEAIGMFGRGWNTFTVEWQEQGASVEEVTVDRITELRQIIQDNHPDRGGDSDKAREAIRELRMLKRATREAA